MKIVIADDEHLLRRSIRHNLEKLNIGSMMIYEAANGAELVGFLREEQPDIALVDIKMPLMDGLNAIEQGKLLSPHTEFAVLTGFAEFDYAQKAVALQVHSYLLKPVTFEQLRDVVSSIHERLVRKTAEFARAFTSRIAGLLTDIAPFENDRIPLEALTYTMIAVCVDGDRDGISSSPDIWLEKLRHCTSQYTSLHFCAAIVKPSRNVWVVICGYDRTGEAGSGSLASCLAELKRLPREHGRKGTAVTTVATGRLPFAQFLAAYEQLVRLSPLRSLLGVSLEYSISFLKRLELDKPHYTAVGKLLCTLAGHQRDLNHIEFASAAAEMLALMESGGLHDNKRAVKGVCMFLHYSIGIPVNPDLTYSRLKSELLDYSQHRLRSSATRANLIQSVIEYVNLHYAANISIAEVARQFDVSPNYLSSLFHKKTGEKFTEYLAELRMKEAQKLLVETDLSIQDITIKIGLYSMSHFGKLFVKFYHASPQEYRKQMLGKS